MALDPRSEQVRLINRALRVTQKLVKKLSHGGTLSRDELRAGELSTQALRSCIADPANAHRVELLIQESERLTPGAFEPPPREPRLANRPHGPRRHSPKGQSPRGQKGPRKPPPVKPKTAKVTVKKKPKLSSKND